MIGYIGNKDALLARPDGSRFVVSELAELWRHRRRDRVSGPTANAHFPPDLKE